MTTEQLKNLIAYLKSQAQNNSKTSAAPAAASPDSGGDLTSALAKAGIKQGLKYGWKEWGKPAWDSLFSETTSAAAESGTALAAEGAGEGALSNLGGTSFSDYAAAAHPYLAVLAPALMAYSAHTKGSGVNEPVRKRAETMGSGRMLTDILAGNKIDPNNAYAQYNLPVKNLLGNQENYPVADPAGYSPYELYTRMHDYSSSSGHPQPGGLGDSGMTDEQIDAMFGDNKGKLSALLGTESLPDWGKLRQTGQADPAWDIWSKGNPQLVSNKKWMGLTPEEQAKYGYDQFRWQQEMDQPLNQITNY